MLALCTALSAQDPDLYYFGITDGQIFWQRDYDNPLAQADLAAALEGNDLLQGVDASQPGLITARLPLHAIRYDGAGIRPEHAGILLTAAQVSGEVVIRLSEGRYQARVEKMVLKMARPSTQGGIDGTHPFEYHFKHHWGIIKNTLFNTYLAAALDFEFNNLFLVARPGEDRAEAGSHSVQIAGTGSTYARLTGAQTGGASAQTGNVSAQGASQTGSVSAKGVSAQTGNASAQGASAQTGSASAPAAQAGSAPSKASRVTLSPIPGEAALALPAGISVHDLRTGEVLEPRNVAKADGFYGQWQCRLFDSDQAISFVCFKPEAFRTQIVSAEREAADSTEALCRRYQAIAGINGSYFNMKELTAVTYIKDEGNVIYADNKSPQANGLVAVEGPRVRIDPCEGKTFADTAATSEPDVLLSGPVLMEDGKMKNYSAESAENQRFYMRRHPRSVIGRDARGAVWLIVVDGRAPGQSEGMSITETAALCWKLGLVEALNLDGGGSSTLWVRSAGVINHPCDNHRFDPYGQRIVPNAILVQ